MTITVLPTPPNRQDPGTFEDRADAFLGALPQFGEEANDLAAVVNGNLNSSIQYASAALQSATNSETSRQAAYASELNSLANAQNSAASSNAQKWVSGTTYAVGQIAWSPANGRIYRRLVDGAGTTDPSSDTSNWKLLSVVVEQEDIGTDPNQIPLNQYLGTMAFQNANAVVIKPQASEVPSGIGDMVFELTSNTSLTIKVRGNDGTVRSAVLTLA